MPVEFGAPQAGYQGHQYRSWAASALPVTISGVASVDDAADSGAVQQDVAVEQVAVDDVSCPRQRGGHGSEFGNASHGGSVGADGGGSVSRVRLDLAGRVTWASCDDGVLPGGHEGESGARP